MAMIVCPHCGEQVSENAKTVSYTHLGFVYAGEEC